jgi:hypothetical protein
MIQKNNKDLYTSFEELYTLFEVLGEGTFSKVYRA